MPQRRAISAPGGRASPSSLGRRISELVWPRLGGGYRQTRRLDSSLKIAGGTSSATPKGDFLQKVFDDDPALETSRAEQAGRLEAENSDLHLRLKESLEREHRLLERVRELEDNAEDAPRMEHELRHQLERLSAFHRAVERSNAWRLLQAARALVGRKW